MTIHNWSALTNGQLIAPFDPGADILAFDDALISAASVSLTFDSTSVFFTYGGKTVALSGLAANFTSASVTFSDGSKLVIGDDSTTTANDDSGNALNGTAFGDQLIGLGGNDTLTGGDGADMLDGGTGADTIDGGVGIDTAFYGRATGPVTVSLAISGTQLTGFGADTLTGIENIIGGKFADRLTGDALNNVLTGGDGHDTLIGGAGDDTLDGGAGDDTASYAASAGAVHINLATGIATDSDGSDTLISIERLVGSAHADTMMGYGSGHEFIGAAGDDVLHGGANIDTAAYNGPSSDYTFDFADGSLLVTDTNVGNGNEGIDTIIGVENAVFLDEVITITEEFRVNNYTNGAQGYSAVAALGDGGFVIVWVSNPQDGSGGDVYAQRYDANGAAVGSEFRVNTHTLNSQDAPAVAALSDGGFVVAWHTVEGWSSDLIYAQRYDANSAPVGSELGVATSTQYDQTDPSITGLSDGGFVVIWQRRDNGGFRGVRARQYETNGAGSEFAVANTYTTNAAYGSVAALSDGGFVVTWEANSDDSGRAVFAQRYDANSLAVGVVFRVNTHTIDRQERPEIAALNDGGFVVAWNSNLQDGSGYGVYAQRYDGTGAAVGSEFRVNTHTNDSQKVSAITGLSDGGFLVTWESTLQDGSYSGVYAQRYDADGAPLGGEFQVNWYTDDSQYSAAVSGLINSGYVISWSSFLQDGGTSGVYAQRYDAAGDPVHKELAGDAGANKLIWADSSAIALTGGAGNDTLIGNSGDDKLVGGDGNDSLSGGAGNDYVDWAPGQNVGIDTLRGGLGDDKFNISAGDVVIEFAGEGNDTVQVNYGGYVLPTGLENLTLIGTLSINGAGNAVANMLTGNAQPNLLDGGAGADTIDGGLGNDTLVGGMGSDLYVVNALGDVVIDSSGPADEVHSLVNYSLGAGIERLILIGSGNVNGTGNSSPNQLTGNEGNNRLIGGNGYDTIDGALGPDTLEGGNGNDLLAGGAGADSLMGGAGNDTLLGEAGNDILIYGASDPAINGGTESDTLKLLSAGIHLDLTLIADTVITDVEVIDLTGSGNNALTVALADVLAVSSTSNTLRVEGDAGDVINAGAGWTDGGIASGYHTWTQGAATLIADTDITQNILP